MGPSWAPEQPRPHGRAQIYKSVGIFAEEQKIADDRRTKDRKYQQQKRNDRNDVGKLPSIKYRAKRKRVLASLEKFYVELFPDLFPDPFGEVQQSSIAHEEHILNTGTGNLNKLEPRGYGKSTRSILAAVWACLKGVQDFVMVCCDSTEKATDLLKLAHTALGENKALLELFPELECFHHLNGNSHRCAYQTYKGKKTKISIKGDTIYFPVLGGKHASEGAMIVARPFKKARGKNVEGRRPTVVILDDVQSSEDALSPTTTSKNVKILTTDIAFLGTRKKPVAVINNATVIRDQDYPSRVAELPAFSTVRYKMVKKFPTNKKLWEQYQQIRQSYRNGDVIGKASASQEALEFYIANRKAMDKGSEVTWDYAYSTARHETSTIQAAMNFITDWGQEAFDSECQNDPQEDTGSLVLLTVSEIMRRTHRVPAEVVPLGHDVVVSMVDVHEEILDYEVWSFQAGFGGAKVLGGTWPKQKRHTFNHASPPKPLSSVYPGMTPAARIDAALDDLFEFLLGREWMRQDKMALHIARCLVDANGVYSDTIKKTCRNSQYAARLTPSYGMGITAKKCPISRLPNNKKKKNIGPEWAPKKGSPGEIKCIIFDANYWKTQFHKQLAMAKGESGALLLHEARPEVHRRSAEGYRSERPTEVSANGRTIYEWELIPNRENHPFDCAVGCMVAASMEGISFVGNSRPSGRKSLAEIQRRKRAVS